MFGKKVYYCGAGDSSCSYNVLGKCKYKEYARKGCDLAKPNCKYPSVAACTDAARAVLALATKMALKDARLKFIEQQNAQILENQKLIMEHFKIKGER